MNLHLLCSASEHAVTKQTERSLSTGTHLGCAEYGLPTGFILLFFYVNHSLRLHKLGLELILHQRNLHVIVPAHSGSSLSYFGANRGVQDRPAHTQTFSIS